MSGPQCMCYMNLHEHTWTALGYKPNSTCKALAKHLPAAKTSGTCKSAYSLSSRTEHVRVTTMKSLNQGHLHPKLEVPRLTCPSRDGTQASALGGIHSRKDPFKQLVDSYLEQLHMSTQPVENARDNSSHPAFCKNLFHMPDHSYVVRIVKTYNLKLFFSVVYRVAAIFPEHFQRFTVTLKNNIFYTFFSAKPSQLSAKT